MPKHKKKDEGTIDITSFFDIKEKDKESKEIKITLDKELEKTIYEKILSSKKITKSKLYEWSKSTGISQVILYKILQSLLKKNMIKREFSEEDQELVFITVTNNNP
ncbi:MAG: hypothetical protein J7K23_03460 [Thermoproteales archaeon]|nr:hypothetical protein [Thermoproteales archaeon]